MLLTLAPPPLIFDRLMFVQLLGVIFDITLSGVGQCRLPLTVLGMDHECITLVESLTDAVQPIAVTSHSHQTSIYCLKSCLFFIVIKISIIKNYILSLSRFLFYNPVIIYKTFTSTPSVHTIGINNIKIY